MFLILAGVAAFPALRAAEASSNLKKAKTMQYALTPLEYGHSALEPWIDAETVGFHHDKHQAAYVANLNAALASEPSFKYEGDVCGLIMNLESVPEKNTHCGKKQRRRRLEPRVLLERPFPE